MERKTCPRRLRLTLLACAAACVFSAAAYGHGGITAACSSNYLFDNIAASIWDNEALVRVTVNPSLRIGGTVEYVNATLNAIQGISTIRNQGISGTFDVSWRPSKLQNRLHMEARGGIDGISGAGVRPRFGLRLDGLAPLPGNKIIHYVKLSPEYWYKHLHLNAAVMEHRIAQQGFAAELSASFFTRLTVACNYRIEYLLPESNVLDTSLLSLNALMEEDSSLLRLPDGKNRIFYSYGYLQLLPWLYAGYAFSYCHYDDDRNTVTKLDWVQGMPPKRSIAWAYYPYNSFRHMLTHSVVIAFSKDIRGRLLWQGKTAFPFYSRQKMSFYWPDELPLGSSIEGAKMYGTVKFTSPLTFSTAVQVNVSPATALSLKYEYFCFGYDEWSYFTKNSYALHTVGMAVKQSF